MHGVSDRLATPELPAIPRNLYAVWLKKNLRREMTNCGLSVDGFESGATLHLCASTTLGLEQGNGIGATYTAQKLARDSSDFLLLGDSGSGKTTFMSQLAEAALKCDEYLPVYFRAKDLARFISNSVVSQTVSHDTVVNFLAKLADSVSEYRLAADAVRGGDALVLCDAVDEVLVPATRSAVALALELACESETPNRLVVSVRPNVLRPSELGALVPLELDPLNRKDQRRLIEAGGLGVEQRRSLLSELEDGAFPLAGNPLFMRATIACRRRCRQSLHGFRAEALELVVEEFVEHRALERPRMLALGLTPKSSRCCAVNIARLAFEAALKGQRCSHEMMGSVIRKCAPKLDDLSAGELRGFFENFGSATGLYVLSDDVPEFAHPSFGEFLAASALVTDEDSVVSLLNERAASGCLALALELLAMRERACLQRVVTRMMQRAEGDPTTCASVVLCSASVLRDSAFDELRQRLLLAAVGFLESPTTRSTDRAILADFVSAAGDARLVGLGPWVVIPAGSVEVGAGEGDRKAGPQEKPQHRVEVSEFSVGRWPVTLEEFSQFVEQGYRKKDSWPDDAGWLCFGAVAKFPGFWARQRSRRGPTCPVTRVSWFEARAYCQWRTRTLRSSGQLAEGMVIRLPTETEWEKAARGGRELSNDAPNPFPLRMWPWGNAGVEGFANTKEAGIGRTLPVGAFPSRSPYGAWDLAGNVFEWCLDDYVKFAYHRREGAVDPVGEATTSRRVMRGGARHTSLRRARTTDRGFGDASAQHSYMGFRCVLGRQVRRAKRHGQ